MDNTRTPTIDFDELLALLGKSFESSEVQEFANKLPEKPIVDDVDFATYLSFEGLGFHIRYDNSTRQVTAVTIWNATLKFSQFKGSLPGGISFSDSQKEVNRKLGQPLRTSIQKGLNFPPEPKGYTDREVAYNEWLAELEKQPVSDLECSVYKFGAYQLELHFVTSENGKLRLIAMEELTASTSSD